MEGCSICGCRSYGSFSILGGGGSGSSCDSTMLVLVIDYGSGATS